MIKGLMIAILRTLKESNVYFFDNINAGSV